MEKHAQSVRINKKGSFAELPQLSEKQCSCTAQTQYDQDRKIRDQLQDGKGIDLSLKLYQFSRLKNIQDSLYI